MSRRGTRTSPLNCIFMARADLCSARDRRHMTSRCDADALRARSLLLGDKSSLVVAELEKNNAVDAAWKPTDGYVFMKTRLRGVDCEDKTETVSDRKLSFGPLIHYVSQRQVSMEIRIIKSAINARLRRTSANTTGAPKTTPRQQPLLGALYYHAVTY